VCVYVCVCVCVCQGIFVPVSVQHACVHVWAKKGRVMINIKDAEAPLHLSCHSAPSIQAFTFSSSTLDLKRVYATPFPDRAGRLPLGQASIGMKLFELRVVFLTTAKTSVRKGFGRPSFSISRKISRVLTGRGGEDTAQVTAPAITCQQASTKVHA